MPEPTSFQNVRDTRFFVAGTDFKLHDDEAVLELLDKGVKKVFVLYPITQKKLNMDPLLSKHYPSIEAYHRKMGINTEFLAKLYENGIHVSSIIKTPKEFRGYESIAEEVAKTKGGILFQCLTGRQSSVAYAAYCLARHSTLPFVEIRKRIEELNPRSTDWLRVQEMLHGAGVDLRKVVETRIAHLNQTRSLVLVRARKTKLKALREKHLERNHGSTSRLHKR